MTTLSYLKKEVDKLGYYSKQIVTAKGSEAIARAAARQSTLSFTSIKTGAGQYSITEISQLAESTGLKMVKQSFPITSINTLESTIQLQSVISNEGITESYEIREIGLFAKEDDGEEFMVSISLNTDNPAVVPVFENVPIEMQVGDFLTVSNTENFSIQYESAAYVTTKEFRRVINGLPLVTYDAKKECITISTGSIAGTGAVLDKETLSESVKEVMLEISEQEVNQVFEKEENL